MNGFLGKVSDFKDRMNAISGVHLKFSLNDNYVRIHGLVGEKSIDRRFEYEGDEVLLDDGLTSIEQSVKRMVFINS